jgi:hypothetical protein
MRQIQHFFSNTRRYMIAQEDRAPVTGNGFITKIMTVRRKTGILNFQKR